MRSLNKQELREINGGSVAKKRERSFFGSAISGIGGAVSGLAGMVASWF